MSKKTTKKTTDPYKAYTSADECFTALNRVFADPDNKADGKKILTSHQNAFLARPSPKTVTRTFHRVVVRIRKYLENQSQEAADCCDFRKLVMGYAANEEFIQLLLNKWATLVQPVAASDDWQDRAKEIKSPHVMIPLSESYDDVIAEKGFWSWWLFQLYMLLIVRAHDPFKANYTTAVWVKLDKLVDLLVPDIPGRTKKRIAANTTQLLGGGGAANHPALYLTVASASSSSRAHTAAAASHSPYYSSSSDEYDENSNNSGVSSEHDDEDEDQQPQITLARVIGASAVASDAAGSYYHHGTVMDTESEIDPLREGAQQFMHVPPSQCTSRRNSLGPTPAAIPSTYDENDVYVHNGPTILSELPVVNYSQMSQNPQLHMHTRDDPLDNYEFSHAAIQPTTEAEQKQENVATMADEPTIPQYSQQAWARAREAVIQKINEVMANTQAEAQAQVQTVDIEMKAIEEEEKEQTPVEADAQAEEQAPVETAAAAAAAMDVEVIEEEEEKKESEKPERDIIVISSDDEDEEDEEDECEEECEVIAGTDHDDDDDDDEEYTPPVTKKTRRTFVYAKPVAPPMVPSSIPPPVLQAPAAASSSSPPPNIASVPIRKRRRAEIAVQVVDPIPPVQQPEVNAPPAAPAAPTAPTAPTTPAAPAAVNIVTGLMHLLNHYRDQMLLETHFHEEAQKTLMLIRRINEQLERLQ